MLLKIDLSRWLLCHFFPNIAEMHNYGMKINMTNWSVRPKLCELWVKELWHSVMQLCGVVGVNTPPAELWCHRVESETTMHKRNGTKWLKGWLQTEVVWSSYEELAAIYLISLSEVLHIQAALHDDPGHISAQNERKLTAWLSDVQRVPLHRQRSSTIATWWGEEFLIITHHNLQAKTDQH